MDDTCGTVPDYVQNSEANSGYYPPAPAMTPGYPSAETANATPGGTQTSDNVDAKVTNSEIAELIAGVDTNLSAFNERAKFYEDLVGKLQSRIELLQNDQIQQLLGPVMVKLAILVTQSAQSVELARAHGEGYQADVEFEFFHDSLIEALDLIGIDSVGVKPGDTFDRAVHASRKSVRTGERALDWTVAKVLRQGLIRPGAERAFLPAQVSVYRYDAALDTAPTQA